MSDASAAIGIVQREGLGRVRHLAVADLWIQHRRSLGSITYLKVNGKDNPADLLTKGLDGESIRRHVHHLNFEFYRGRHQLAPKLVSHSA